MSGLRFLTVLRADLGEMLRRPLFWVLVVILGLTAYGLAGGNVRIASGDASVGGTKAWLTSEFAQAQMLSMVIFIFYMFFIAVGAGMALIRDEELKVGEILHATRLTFREYVWGKFWAVVLGFSVVLAAHLLLTVFFNQVFPNANADEIRGPFHPVNYLRPGLVFGLPTILFFAGTTFAVGGLSRRPILVFVIPVAAILSTFFLWDWSPGWLDPRINRALMLLEPSGFRWLNETWLKMDEGVDFYNTQAVGYDTGFLLSRLALAGVGLFGVWITELRLSRTLRGSRRAGRAGKAPAAPAPAADPLDTPALGALGMARERVRFRGGALTVARFELKELAGTPGLYLFGPIILLQIIGSAMFETGAFDTPVLLTSGYLATRTLDTITLMVVFLLLFYTVESLRRENGTGLASIYYSGAVSTPAILFGKSLANALVGVVILLVSLLACVVALLIQGRGVGVDLAPFLVTWPLVLVPTFLVWTAYVTAVYALVRNRYLTYAVGLGSLILFGWRQSQGKVTWVTNWMAWDTLQWSDFGLFEMNLEPLLLNRLLVLAFTVFLVALAVRLFPRMDRDATRTLHRIQPAALLRGALPLLPLLVVPLALGVVLYRQVDRGFQGDAMEKAQEDYWKGNLATWKDAPLPAVVHQDVTVDLWPGERRLRSEGFMVFRNHLDEPLAAFALTGGVHWDSLSWTLDGREYEPDETAHLYVIEPERPLAPGDEVTVGWSFEGRHPGGYTRNGGGTGTFVLPSSVVLTSFGADFCPLLGWQEDVGVDEDNQYESRKYREGYHEGITPSLFGNDIKYTARTVITGPEDFTLNGAGIKLEDAVADGRRRVVWETDHPVDFVNIVAGRWNVRRGEGTALYHHPDHVYNLDEMIEALDGARRWYSEWFYEFPWEELKVSEFAAHATYAQGFPTNITFSEGIGFLTKSDPRANAAFLVTAHEAAHQWWGNILAPGKGPGGNILSEGMSHFSTLMLFEQVKGPHQRMETAKRMEEGYTEGRRADSERALVWIDGSKPGDTTVTYDKGGWVFWMLMQLMGREGGLAGYSAFIHEYSTGPDHALLQDFLRVMRGHAPDPAAFDAFVDQWFLDVVLPEYRFHDAEVVRDGGDWVVRARIENRGTGTMPLVVAAERGERFPEGDDGPGAETASLNGVPAAHAGGADDRGAEGAQDDDAYRAARTTVTLEAGESAELEIRCAFEPRRLVADPDVQVLQRNRDQALVRF